MERFSDLLDQTINMREFMIARSQVLLLSAICLAIFGCNLKNKDSDDDCVPVCGVDNECKSDGCGGVCGCFDEEQVCGDDDLCVPADECTGDCGNRECGKVCGEPCGDNDGKCEDGEQCIDGKCECEPRCDNIRCGQDDGCGGACGCDSGQICDEEHSICVDDDTPCAGRECGTFGGMSCGTCDEAKAECDDEGQCKCTPNDCDGRCGDDGCGGDCGDCSEVPGNVCNADGECVPECLDTCSDVGWQCGGSICGNDCGTCPDGEKCENHICVCAPNCQDDDCGKDGCGGMCGCAGDFEGFECDPFTFKCVEDCDYDCKEVEWKCGNLCGILCGDYDGECAGGDVCIEGKCIPAFLKMTLLGETETDENGWTTGSLLVQYTAREGVTKPRMVDLRLTTDWAVEFEIISVVPGMAMAGKEIYLDPDKAQVTPWRLRPDGALQMLIYSLKKGDENSDTLETGNLLTINFAVRIGEVSGTDEEIEQVAVSLIRREKVFAPFEADIALQDTSYDLPVVVTK